MIERLQERYISDAEAEIAAKPETTTDQEREVWIGGTYAFYKPVGEVRQLPKGEGFAQGAFYPPEHDLFSEATQKENVLLVEAAAKKVMAAKGWDDIDILVGASISARRAVPHRAARSLREQGISIGQSLDYACACMGAMGAMGDMLMNPEHKGKRVVIIAYEFLTGNAMSPADTKAYNTTRNIFGSGITGLGFEAGVDIEAINATVMVQPDLLGVIQVPQAETTLMDEGEEALIPPSYYHYVDPITHEVQGDDFDWSTQSYFAMTKNGVRLQMPPTQTGYTEMDGKKTLELFATYGSKYLVDFERDFIDNLQPIYGPPGEPMAHQPSEVVLNGLIRKAQLLALLNRLRPTHVQEESERKAAKAAATTDRERQAIDQRYKDFSRSVSHANNLAKKPVAERSRILQGTGIPVIDLPWMMDQALVNNISSGTSVVELIEMARQGRIKTEVVTQAIGFAIGAMFGFYNLIFHEQNQVAA